MNIINLLRSQIVITVFALVAVRTLHRLLPRPAQLGHPHPSPDGKRPAMKTAACSITRSAVAFFVAAALIIAAIPCAHAEVTNGLVGWWKFDEGTGTVANDSSGNANQGAISGATWTVGKPGLSSALSFNGSSSFVSVNNAASLNPTAAITIAAWVKATTWNNNGRILEKGDSTDNQYMLLSGAGNNLWFRTVGVTPSDLRAPLPSTNEWHHVAATYDGALAKIYVDGLVVTQQVASGILSNTTQPLAIGRKAAGPMASDYYSGLLDDVRIYNRALSSSEITELQSSYSDTDGDGMPDWWEVQYGLNPTAPNGDIYGFGTGGDGDLTVPVGQTITNSTSWTSVVGSSPAGTDRVGVASTNGFGADDLVLLIAMQDTSTNLSQNVAGQHEFHRVWAVGSNFFILRAALSNSFDGLAGKSIQVLKVPEYESVTINGTLTCPPWNGTNGGVLTFMARAVTLNASGSINADGKGYRGGSGVPGLGDAEWGMAGERTTGFSSVRETNSLERAQGGGGAGRGADGSGGGGGYGTAGTNGAFSNSSSDYGRGATAYGTTTLSRLHLGGGGGGSGSHNNGRIGVGGGSGGGVVFVGASALMGSGIVSSRGAPGTNGVYVSDQWSGSGGGGGAAGSVYLIGSITNTISLVATGGAGGLRDTSTASSKNGGAGGMGRIRIDAANTNLLPFSIPAPGFVAAPAPNPWLFGVADFDNDGLDDLEEFQLGTAPNNPDTDNDDMPDKWEVDNGTNPTIANANDDLDSDGLSNGLEFALGSAANDPDTNNDGIPDGVAYYTYHLNPAVTDTDGDGMDDAWEIAQGLNPTLNDASGDRDLDGLSNFTEYTNRANGYFANIANSKLPGLSDFEAFYGYQTNRFYYDKIDRLIGAEYNHGSNGLSIAYVYDGNGNIKRQKHLQRDASGNGLPDLYEFQNNLTNNASAYTDTDGDGWTDWQEWHAGSNAGDSSSVPDVLGVAGTNLVSMTWPFTPSNFVMAVGQLDGTGPEEIVIGADGNPGTTTNFFLLLSQTTSGWTTQKVDVGSVGITSLAIGQVSTNIGPAIYFGSRVGSGTSTVCQVTRSNSLWAVTKLSTGSMGQVAYVLGLRSNTIVAQMANTNDLDQALFSVGFFDGAWVTFLVSTNTSRRGIGTVVDSLQTSLRLLDIGGIEAAAPTMADLISSWQAEGNANDAKGVNNGVLNNGVTFVTGKNGQAFSFDGVNDYISVADSPSLRPQQFTISAWCKPGRTGVNQTIAAKMPASSNPGDGYEISQRANGVFWFGIGKGGTELVAQSTTSPNINSWQHVAGTFNGSAMKIYINGNLEGSNTFNTSINASNSFIIGSVLEGTPGPFQGLIDEVTLFSRVFTATEIQLLYTQAPIPPGIFLTSEPVATQRRIWNGQSLASGSMRQIGSSSLSYTYFDDKNTNAVTDFGDDYVVCEAILTTTNIVWVSTNKLALPESQLFPSYGLACANYLNSTNEVLFTGEPDGRIFSWVATSITGALKRQLFSSTLTGKAWHQLEAHKGLIAGEALTGLWVDSSNPATCNLAYFAPASALPTFAEFPQNAPIATILPMPNSGQGIAEVSIRLWDAEGNLSLPELQYSTNNGVTWSNVTIASSDGGALNYVPAAPNGSSHQLLWNAAANLGAPYSNTVQLRLRARDNSLIGDWSPTNTYTLLISPGAPIAANDVASTLEDVPLTLAVLTNDFVTNGLSLTISNLIQPVHGVASVISSNTVFYTPATNYSGPDSFSYTATDGLGGTSVASVSITVVPVNDPPIAQTYTSFSTTEDFPMSLRWNPARDVEGDTVTLQSAGPTSANGGTVSVSDGVLTYTPAPNFNGADTFSYTLVDDGTTAGTNDFKTGMGTITVTVYPVNDAPVIAIPGPQTIAEDLPLIFGPTNAVSVADVDAGTNAMLFSLSSAQGRLTLASTNGLSFTMGTNGGKTLVFNALLADATVALSNLTYLPDAEFSGADILNVVADDLGGTGSGGAKSDSKAVSISITNVNDLPFVQITSPTNNASFIAPATVTINATASDVDGQVVKVEFYSGTNWLGEKTNQPYLLVWSNVTGIHTLSAVATDNQGATNVSQAVIIDSKTPGFVQLDSPAMLPGNTFTMLILGDVGQVYSIEASTNLMTWQNVGTVTNLTGTAQFQETVPPGTEKRYYRALLLQ